MTWLALIFAFEMGMTPGNGWYLYEANELYEPGAVGYYTTLEAELEAGPVFVGGSLRTDMQPNSLTNYNPHWVTYDFNAGLRFDPFEVGYRHRCSHPIQTYVYNQEYLRDPLLEGSYDEVYARVQVEVGR